MEEYTLMQYIGFGAVAVGVLAFVDSFYLAIKDISSWRKKDSGLENSLEEQLKDDPNFIDLTPRKFKQAMKKIENEYLGPLECVDNYLSMLGRDGLYDTVSKGRVDREGRWQAFIDYHKSVYQKLADKKKLVEMGIDENEVGRIEDVAFKIIRKREIPTMGKVHQIMRSLPKWLSNPDAKKELLRISNIDNELPEEETVNKDGEELDPTTIDKFWGERNKTEITKHIEVAKKFFDYNQISETPLTLLEAALKKLKHEKMELKSIQVSDQSQAKVLISGIRERIKEIEHEFYQVGKRLKKQAHHVN